MFRNRNAKDFVVHAATFVASLIILPFSFVQYHQRRRRDRRSSADLQHFHETSTGSSKVLRIFVVKLRHSTKTRDIRGNTNEQQDEKSSSGSDNNRSYGRGGTGGGKRSGSK